MAGIADMVGTGSTACGALRVAGSQPIRAAVPAAGTTRTEAAAARTSGCVRVAFVFSMAFPLPFDYRGINAWAEVAVPPGCNRRLQEGTLATNRNSPGGLSGLRAHVGE